MADFLRLASCMCQAFTSDQLAVLGVESCAIWAKLARCPLICFDGLNILVKWEQPRSNQEEHGSQKVPKRSALSRGLSTSKPAWLGTPRVVMKGEPKESHLILWIPFGADATAPSSKKGSHFLTPTNTWPISGKRPNGPNRGRSASNQQECAGRMCGPRAESGRKARISRV